MSLQSQLNSFVGRVAEKFAELNAQTGSLENLDTAAKTDLVAAINELAGRAAGGDSAVAYVHAQRSAETVWTINHNLGLRPAVTLIDTGGNEIDADVIHISVNQLVIHFAIPVAGVARLT
jgi:hypothetical protein